MEGKVFSEISILMYATSYKSLSTLYKLQLIGLIFKVSFILIKLAMNLNIFLCAYKHVT